jgi:sulfur-carrier protein
VGGCKVRGVTRVAFTANLRRHVACPPAEVDGATVGEVLHAYFALHPAVATYILDEQGAVRRHVAVFVGREQVTDRTGLTDVVSPDDEIHVMQALSGG